MLDCSQFPIFLQDCCDWVLCNMGSHLGLICSKGPGLWGTVPCPLGTFDAHPQGRLGTFKIKMAANNARCLILVAFTEKKRGTVNSLTVCQFWHLSYNPDVQHIRSALREPSQLRNHAELDTTFASLKSVYFNLKSNLCIGYIWKSASILPSMCFIQSSILYWKPLFQQTFTHPITLFYHLWFKTVFKGT